MAEVFISYSSMDEDIANMVCNALESNGIKCWIAPRDIAGGADWQPSIIDAISESRVFIVIYSENSSKSSQVARELALADEKSDHPRTIIPYRIDNTELIAGFKYYLTSSHWVSADRNNNDLKTDILIDSVNKALGKETTNITVNNVTINAVIHNDNRTVEPEIKVVEVTPPTRQVASGPIKISTKPTVNKPVPPAPENVTAEKKPLPVKTIAIAGGVLVAVILLIVLIVSLSGNENDRVSESTSAGTSSSVSQNSNASVSEGIVYYPDIKPYENSNAKVLENSYEEFFTVLGKEYNTGIVLNAYAESYVIFNCDGYDKVKFTVARVDNTAKGENVIRVFADDKELNAVKTDQFSAPQTVEYDVSGKSQLRIAILQSNGVRADIAVMDICFYKDGEVIEENSSQDNQSADLVAVPSEKKPYENNNAEILDNSYEKSYLVLGKEYNTGIKLNAYAASYVIFDNSDGYETFYLTAAKVDNTDRGENYIRVYADDKELEPISFGQFSSPTSMQYDIKGAKQVRVTVEQSNTSRADILLYNMCFAKNNAKPEVKVEDNSNLPDVIAVPTEKKPYENYKSTTLVNDYNESCFILGKEHNTGIKLNAYAASYVIFDNNDGYEKLYLTAAKADNTDKGDNYIRVYADGKELQPIVLGKYSLPQKAEYNVKGVKQISIAVDQNNTSRADILLYDMYFTKNGKEPEKVADKTEYADLAVVPTDYEPYENVKSGIYSKDTNNKFMVCGKEYNTGIVLNAYAGSEFALYNHGKYEKLCFTISKVDGTAEGGNEVCVIIDGVEEYYDLSSDSEPQIIELDMKGKKQVIFKVTQNNQVRADILIYDMYFSKNGAKPENTQ